MQELSVQVRTTPLREQPTFLGRVLRELGYAERVGVVESSDDWRQVEYQGQRGWLHVSALTEKRIVLNPGADDVQRATTDRELALAGRGFNAEVEQEYRQRHAEINFAAVDQMERRSPTLAVIDRFARDGGLERV